MHRATIRIVLTLLSAASLAAGVLPAQAPPRAAPPATTGRVVGRVLEQETGAPVAGAEVGVAGTVLRAVSAVDGRYTLLDVPAGTVAIRVRAIGYAPKTVAGVVVAAGSSVLQDLTLAPQAVQLGEITVSAAAERGSVSAALAEQRNADAVVSAVTAEEIGRSPDGDAGQAVQRVSGVTVQDGRYVFVRGLGERYTTTSLNSARIPSPEPERRVVPLDLFPAGLLAGITTVKTFTPDQPGDFSGAQVNLRTREFPTGRVTALAMSTGFNTAITGRTVARAPTVGSEWLGLAGQERALPASARRAGDLTGLAPADLSRLIGDFRNAWSSRTGSAAPNGSVSLGAGGEAPVLGQPVGYIGSVSYAATQEIRRDERRARADIGPTPGTAVPQNEYRGETVSGGVLWGGMLSLSTRVRSTTRLDFTNTYSRSADNGATRLRGYNEDLALDLDVTRLAFVERSARSHQVAGQHRFGLRHHFAWAVTSSAVRRYEPDRSDLFYDVTAGRNEWFGFGRSATRTFSELDESAWEVAGSYRVELGARRRHAVKAGGSWRRVERDADSRAYNIINQNLSQAERALPPEQIFRRTEALTLIADAQVGRYTAEDRVAAGFVQLEVALGDRLRLVGGARVERWDLELRTRRTDGQLFPVTRRATDVLPALSATWRLTDRQNLRASASQTLSRPEYRELAFVTTRDIAGGLDAFGNPSLRRALIRNYDLRWELYPSPGEVVSVAVFAKRFEDPIERIVVGATGAVVNTFVNADGADNYGVELEVRRNLGALSPSLVPLALFANVTLMRSDITPGNDSLSSLASASRPMVGQANYVVNAGLTYTSPGGAWIATLLYNVVGRRIAEAATVGLPDATEEPRHLVDASLRFPLLHSLSAKLDARNLLDAPYRIRQGAVTRQGWRTGRQVAVGLTWQP
jgi:outer membrane receptor protein involved in Fe transport